MKSNSFQQFAGLSGILAGVAGFLYAVAFVVLKDPLLYSLLLALGGIFSAFALVGLYQSLRDTDTGWALAALVFSVIGATGASIHGAYDLSNAINPPDKNLASLADLPSQIDPRGLLTFGFAGIGLFFFAWLMSRNNKFPKMLTYLAYLVAALSVELYLARLIILTPANPLILIPVAITGFIANPAWYIWLGLTLRKGN
jgi:hypothetical protein